MPLALYVATTNAGKLRDFAAAAEASVSSAAAEIHAARLLGLPGMDRIPAPPENAPAFEENAVAKALYYSHAAPGLIVLADDSGLEVDALGGAPGVRSARYAADAAFPCSAIASIPLDQCNNLFLLENLQGIPATQRTARYRCALAAARDGQCIAVGHGSVEGVILEAPRGNGGFGYDPLFYLPELGQTMAEISLPEKHRISHRGHALRGLLARLNV